MKGNHFQTQKLKDGLAKARKQLEQTAQDLRALGDAFRLPHIMANRKQRRANRRRRPKA